MVADQTLRPAQTEILRYEEGLLGVSAVPGSGKTFTLSRLAAKLVRNLTLSGSIDDREVLVVTFTNAAVENFRARINQFIRDSDLLPGGFRVRTLHSLAHDIVRERPGLVGLEEGFPIVDERTGEEARRRAVDSCLRTQPDLLRGLVDPEHLGKPDLAKQITNMGGEVARALIERVKDLRADPELLDEALRGQSGAWPLLSFGLQVYRDYQRGLALRGGVDFNDLILLAIRALESDEDFLARLQMRWPYVLEDEAQDSSSLQERMLSLLTSANGNWVRVGDPNQAINTTFTSADPKFLLDFVGRKDVSSLELPDSGRCAQPIIDLANRFIDWSRTQHPVLAAGEALAPPHIRPTGPGDPQPNPEPGDPVVYVYDRPLSRDEEIGTIVDSLGRWLPQNPHRTAAVLALMNDRAAAIARACEKASLPCDDSLLRSTSASRAAVDALVKVLRFIGQSQSPSQLRPVWTDVWWTRKGLPFLRSSPEPPAESRSEEGASAWWNAAPDTGDPAPSGTLPQPVQLFGRALGQIREPERFLFPAAGDDWMNGITWIDDHDRFRQLAERFRNDLRGWCNATVLPIDELVLTLGRDLFEDPLELAIAHSAAVLLGKRAAERPHLRLVELTGELVEIGRNQRRLLGFQGDAGGYEPQPGKVTVATMHTAKGLEWDRVYLTSVSSYDFPGGGDEDSYIGERRWVRDGLNLTEEALAQLDQLHMGTLDEYAPGRATAQARRGVAAERLRLLYVGITRAKQELILTYNTGRYESSPNTPALAFTALRRMWNDKG